MSETTGRKGNRMNNAQTKHTPGPWKWRAVPNEGGQGTLALLLETEHRPIPLNDPCVLAVREDWIRALKFDPPGSADARLIAAAPELWEALTRVLMWAPKSTEAACEQDYEFARALLSRLSR